MEKYILLAEEGERALLDKAQEELGLEWGDAKILYTGVGAINIIRTLQDLDREAELVNVGYAGSANFDIGTWVAVTEARLNHPAVSYEEPELKVESLKWKVESGKRKVESGKRKVESGKLKEAVCYTNTDFVLQSDYKDCVFDMELAFIAALGFKKLHSLKYVSDNLSLHAYHELTNGVE